MPTSQQLREQRATIWSQMQEVMTRAEREGRDLSAEERSTYDAAETDLDRIGGDLERQERHEGRAATFDQPDRSRVVETEGRSQAGPGEGSGREGAGDGEAAYRAAFDSWVRGGDGDLDREQRSVLRTGWVSGAELRAAGVATNAAGGYTVPPAFRNKVIEAATLVSPMRQYAEVLTTDTGATLPWPTADDTANEGAILAENTQVTEQDTTFGIANVGAYMYTSKLIRVSFQLIQDSGIDIEAYIGRIAGARIGRVQNRHFTVGTGTSQPTGIVTASPVAKVGAAGQVATYTYEDLVDLTDALDPAYLGGNNLNWMMSQAARKSVRKLKDGQNRPLWEPSLQVGTPDNLLGYGIILNNNVPAPAASAKSLLFGDYRQAYLVRDVADFQLLRLAERYAEYLQVGFLGFQRSDGTVQNAAAVRAFQHPAA